VEAHMKARQAILVLAIAVANAPVARPAAEPEMVSIQTSSASVQIALSTNWTVAPKPTEMTPCLDQQVDCIRLSGALFVLTFHTPNSVASAARIIVTEHQEMLQTTIDAFADRYKSCAWPYATSALPSLRCAVGLPVGRSVERIGLQSIDAHTGRMSLYEYRSRPDSVPLWAVAYVPAGRDVHEFTFSAQDAQSYRSGLAAFREMLSSYRVLPKEVQ
jgi:hypothetical protein